MTGRRLVLGTAGHIDHGKTALVRALTGVDTDRLPDEKRRGITIDLGFARLDLPDDVRFAVVDVPGHEAFVRNMVAGAAGVDVALLVVAADESVMPQTREHAAILELLAIPRLVVALTKTDLVDAPWLELVRDEVGELLATTAHGDAPVVAVSARTGEGLDELRSVLAAAGAAARQRRDADLLRLPVDRAFSVHGTGTVVTGTIWSGTVAADAALRLLPSDRPVRARGLQVHGEARAAAGAGERAALALAGADPPEVPRGEALVHADEPWRPSRILTVRLSLLAEAPAPLVQRQRVRLHLGTAEVMARVRLLQATTLAPGDSAWAQLRLEAPVLARARDRFVVRRYSPLTTLGGGAVAEPAAGRRRRLDAAAAEHLRTVLAGDPQAALAALVALAGAAGVPADELPLRTGYAPAVWDDASLGSGVARVGDRLLPGAALAAVADGVLDAVDAHHRRHPLSPGAPLDALRSRAQRGAAPGMVDAAIAHLRGEGALVVEGPQVRRSAFRPTPTPGQTEALAEIVELYTSAGLTPPEEGELPPGVRAREDLPELLDHLVRVGTLVQIRPGLLAVAEAIETAATLLRQTFPAERTLTASELKEPLQLTRKHLIPLLEHFDRTGVTRRQGDLRTVLPPPAP